MEKIGLKDSLAILRDDDIKHLLEPGELGATFELIVSDPKTGRIIEHRPQEKSKSFVRQFLELLWIQALPINMNLMYQLRNTVNAPYLLYATCINMAANAPIAVDTWGIQVGTGIVVPDIGDFALGTKILHDAAPPTAGRMQYSLTTFGAPASDATTSQCTVTRNFANASGGLITPTEIGLVVKGYRYNTNYYFLVIRDVIAGGIAVANGLTLTVNYRPQAVV